MFFHGRDGEQIRQRGIRGFHDCIRMEENHGSACRHIRFEGTELFFGILIERRAENQHGGKLVVVSAVDRCSADGDCVEKEFILERGIAYRQTGVLIIVIQDNRVFLGVIVEVKFNIIHNTFAGQSDAIGTDFDGICFGGAELDGEG